MVYPKFTKYKILRKICKKHCFTLFEAQDEYDGKKIFLKILDKKLANDGVHVYNFLNGARLTSLINSENIGRVYYYGKENDYYIIAAETIEFKPLNMYIHEEYPISLEKVINVTAEIAKILRQAHLRGVVHGLLNPGSIYIAEDGTIKIDDFCYYWITPFLFELEEAEAIYLSYHIAPEVYQAVERIDGRVDIYSLGVILLQLLTDYIPFNYFDHVSMQNKRLIVSIRTLRKILPDYPRRLDRIILKSLNKNPELRFQNLKEFEQELELLKKEYLDTSSTDDEKGEIVLTDYE